MFDLLAGAIGAPLAKLLVKKWLGDDAAAIGGPLIDWLKGKGAKELEARRAGRLIEDLADNLVQRLTPFFEQEAGRGVELEPVVVELGETLAAHATAKFLLEQRLDPARLHEALKEARPEAYRDLSEAQSGIYDRALFATSEALSPIASQLPHFQVESVRQSLDALDELVRRSEAILQAVLILIDRPRHRAETFEADYLAALLAEHDHVEILGIEELQDPRVGRAKLSIAYLSLTARLQLSEKPLRIDFATLLALLPKLDNRLLIEGGAGSGKSTLMRWATTEAARFRLTPAMATGDVLAATPELDAWLNFLHPLQRDESPPFAMKPVEHPFKALLREGAWRARLPFLVPLRSLKGALELQDLLRLSARMSFPPPETWLQEAFAQEGAGIVLILDGVDEVPAGSKRDALLKQIQELAARFTQAQIIVTTRPGAVPEGWLGDFRKVELDELDDQQRLDFIAHWHEALAANYGRLRDDAVVDRLRQALLLEIERQPALARLATNPLLCAAICALHWLDRRRTVEDAWRSSEPFAGFGLAGLILPESLWGLCESLTRMLVHQRDLVREIGTDTADNIGTGLGYQQKREILAQLAYGMTAGELRSSMSHAEALGHVAEAMKGLPGLSAMPNEVLRYLLIRSGVLRGSGQDGVEFVHNTLKAFLAAKFYLGLGVPNDLVRRLAMATDAEVASGLDEIAVFAAANPDHAHYSERLLQALLEGQEKQGAFRRWFGAQPGKSAGLRRLQILAVRCEAAATGRLSSAARETVKSLAVRLFPPRDAAEARQLATLGNSALRHLSPKPKMSIETLVASAHCLRLIGTTAAREALRAYLDTQDLSVAEELILIFHPLEISAVRKATEDYQIWSEKIPPSLKERISDLEPLRGLSDVQTLSLDGTQVQDLEPLRGLAGLRGLFLNRTQVQNLEPLRGLAALQALFLYGTQVQDLEPLRGLAALQSLYLASTQVQDLEPLRGLFALQRLYLNNTQVQDLEPLRGLAGLQTLSLDGTQVQDLEPLRGLAGLQTLSLASTQVQDLEPLRGLAGLKDLWLDDRQKKAGGKVLKELKNRGVEVR